PEFTFTADTDTGIYRVGADNLGISTNGVARRDVNTARVQQTVPLIVNVAVSGADVPVFQLNRANPVGGGFEVVILDAITPGGDTGIQVGRWEGGVGSYPPVSAASGYRWRLEGDEPTKGALVFYSHGGTTTGREIYRHHRNTAQMYFVSGSPTSPTIAWSS